jgi:hypothetical protein
MEEATTEANRPISVTTRHYFEASSNDTNLVVVEENCNGQHSKEQWENRGRCSVGRWWSELGSKHNVDMGVVVLIGLRHRYVAKSEFVRTRAERCAQANKVRLGWQIGELEEVAEAAKRKLLDNLFVINTTKLGLDTKKAWTVSE